MPAPPGDRTLSRGSSRRSSARAAQAAWALTVLHSPRREWLGRSVPLGRQLRLGRVGGEVDLQIDDPKLSRVHASVSRAGLVFEIRDLGSRNGTFINGERVERHSLTVGDVVRVGDTLFENRSGGAATGRRAGRPFAGRPFLRTHRRGGGRRPRRPLRLVGPVPGRDRDREGSLRPAGACAQRAPWLLPGDQLCLAPAGARRIDALRSQEGGLHRRHCRFGGALRPGPRRDAVPRRGRRAPRSPAGQAPAGPGESRVLAGGQYPGGPEQRAHHRRQQCRPRCRDRLGRVPGGSLCPARRNHHPAASPAIAAEGHPGAGGVVSLRARAR